MELQNLQRQTDVTPPEVNEPETEQPRSDEITKRDIYACLALTIVLTGFFCLLFFAKPPVRAKPVGPYKPLPRHLKPIRYDLYIQADIIPPFNFNGSVEIEFMCEQSSQNVTLNLVELEVSSVELRSSSKSIKVNESHLYDKIEQFVIILDEDLKENQIYYIKIDFKCDKSYRGRGFFLDNYDTEGAKWYATTNFYPTHARRAFPCMDEPAMKAKFNITIAHSNITKALSNTNKLFSKQSEDGRWIIDSFETTPIMSTYSVGFAITDFESKSKGNVTVWASAEEIHKLNYTLELAGKFVDFFTDYFNISYELPKLDMISIHFISNFCDGRRNWGLIILYRNDILDGRNSKEEVAFAVARSLAHQWIGNLVGPDWWTDVWLNEGLVEYLSYAAVQAVEPDFNVMIRFMQKIRFETFDYEWKEQKVALASSFEESNEICLEYHQITNKKAASIIHMLNYTLTEPVLRAGLRDHLNKLKYKTAKASDLWHHLTKAQTIEDPINIDCMMRSWTVKSHYPEVTLSRDYSTGGATVTQSDFIDGISTSEDVSKWEIPISLTNRHELDWNSTTRVWMYSDERGSVQVAKQFLPRSNDDWMLINVNQVGHYRVNYDERNWRLIIKQLEEQPEKISQINRGQLWQDSTDLEHFDRISKKIRDDIDSLVNPDGSIRKKTLTRAPLD